MGKTAIEAKRGNVFLVEPERLTLATDKNHPLYDPRAEDAPDERMVANIAAHGVIEPVIVRRDGNVILVVAGRGRTKAAVEANRRLAAEGKEPLLVPVIIRGGSDADLFGVMVAENELRREDSVLAKGEKARKLLNMGYTVQQIAVTFGASRQAVDTWLAAEELPQPIKEAVESGEISATTALLIPGNTRGDKVRTFEELKSKTMPKADDHQGEGRRSDRKEPGGRSGKKDIAFNIKLALDPPIKKRREIERRLTVATDDGDAASGRGEGYMRGYRDALNWVLGKNGQKNEGDEVYR